MIAALLHRFRAWRINAIQQDTAYASAQFDAYLHEQADKLAALRAKQYAGRSSAQIARQCEQRAKALQ